MKKLGVLVLAAGMLLGLSACDTSAETTHQNSSYEFTMHMDDGREVLCVKAGHGMSCDWENAK